MTARNHLPGEREAVDALIRRRATGDATIKEIAAEFGTTERRVHRAIKGESSRLTIAERYQLRLDHAAKGRAPSKVWRECNIPDGFAVDELQAEAGRDVFFWHAVNERTGDVDSKPFVEKADAVRRTWELALEAEKNARGAA